LQLHEVGTGKEVWRIDSSWMSTEPETLAFSPDGKMLFAKRAEPPGWVLRRYNARTGKHFAAPEEERGNFRAMVFAPDDRSLYTLNGDRRLRAWNAATGVAVRQAETPFSPSCAFSPDGRLLASSDDREQRLILLDSGKELWRQRRPEGLYPSAVAFSSDGSSLAVVEWGNLDKGGHRIVFRSSASGQEQGQINGLDKPPYDVLFNPDGRSLLWLAPKSDFERMILFGERASGRKLREPLSWLPMTLDPVAFSPDGKTLAFALAGPDWKSVDLWEFAVWKKRLELPPVTHLPCPLAFSPDGLLCMIGDDDGAVRIFDAHTGRLLRRQQGHRAEVSKFAFSHDGRTLVTVSQDTTALVWDISDLLRTARGSEHEIPSGELKLLWEDLALEDAAKAYQAIGRLARSRKQVLPWLRKHLQPVPAVDARRVAKLVAELDDDRFAIREKATNQLVELGERAIPQLRKALSDHPSLELRQRAEALLKQVEAMSSHKLRISRSVEVVEAIGGNDAERLLREWAGGAAGASLTSEAKAALERLARRHRPSRARSAAE
jgi:WD40 repeat protein